MRTDEHSSRTAESGRLLRPDDTCWKVCHVDRLAILIDGERFFAAARAAMIRAERRIHITAWEFHTRIVFDQDAPADATLADGWPNRLYDFFAALSDAKPELEIRILVWDFSLLFASDRELAPVLTDPWCDHPRITYRLDSAHAKGASHHQKLVVVDGSLAFSGGLDVTQGRWDTRAHKLDDTRRRTPEGALYGPFHDIQLMVDGDGAACLAALFRYRWERAGGEIATPCDARREIWPDAVEPDMRDVEIGIARTFAAHRDEPEVREVERLFLAAIASARRWIYMENQYLTSAAIGNALAESLAGEDGPEIVLVLPRRNWGWLELVVMGLGRERLLARLREADTHGRLAVYYPALVGEPDEEEADENAFLKVHAKVSVIDDRLARVGSANLSNRSMGLDSECDIAVEAGPGDDAIAASVARLRNDLLAEHLGRDRASVAREIGESGSLIAAIEKLRRPTGRTLKPIEDELDEYADSLAPDTTLLDPDRPFDFENIADAVLVPGEGSLGSQRIEPEHHDDCRRGLWWLGGLLALIAALALAWQMSPFGEQLSPQALTDWIGAWREGPAASIAALATFTALSLFAFPITIVISALGLLFGPVLGFLAGMGVALASAAIAYGVGWRLGRESLERLTRGMTRGHGDRVAHWLRGKEVAGVAVLRMLPVAPFAVVNLLVGASPVRFHQFMIGTVLGMAPGALALAILGDRLFAVLRSPSDAMTIGSLLGAVALVFGLSWGLVYWLGRRVRTA